MAATIGPTPVSSSRSGRQERTIARIARSWSAASVSQDVDAAGQGAQHRQRGEHLARRRRAALGRSRAAVASICAGGLAAEPGPDRLGAVIDQRPQLPLTRRWPRRPRRAARSAGSAARPAAGAGLGLGQPGPGQRVAGGAFGVDHDRTSPPPGGPGGPGGRAPRPAPPARRGGGPDRRRSRRCPRSPTPAARRAARPGRPARRSRLDRPPRWPWPAPRRCSTATTAAVWVSVWVSTPMTSSTSSASMDMRSPDLDGR